MTQTNNDLSKGLVGKLPGLVGIGFEIIMFVFDKSKDPQSDPSKEFDNLIKEAFDRLNKKLDKDKVKDSVDAITAIVEECAVSIPQHVKNNPNWKTDEEEKKELYHKIVGDDHIDVTSLSTTLNHLKDDDLHSDFALEALEEFIYGQNVYFALLQSLAQFDPDAPDLLNSSHAKMIQSKAGDGYDYVHDVVEDFRKRRYAAISGVQHRKKETGHIKGFDYTITYFLEDTWIKQEHELGKKYLRKVKKATYEDATFNGQRNTYYTNVKTSFDTVTKELYYDPTDSWLELKDTPLHYALP